MENFILSQSMEVLTLRSIDDFAMQTSVRRMQNALLAGNWHLIFGFFDYAYGNAFWLFNSILLLPLYFINDEQALIVVGRQISLFFVFGSIYIVSLIIDRIRPDGASMKFPILITIATMPMVSIISTKFHVNPQSIFFGIFAFYLLVRDAEISKSSLRFSAVFAGIAAGFKLTGFFIIPLLCITLLDKLRKSGFKKAVVDTSIYLAISLIIAAAFTAPGLLLFPFFTNELSGTYKTFLLFLNMQNTEAQLSANILWDTFRFYFSPLSLIAIFVSFVFLIFDDANRRQFISIFIFGSIFSTLLLLVLIVPKGPIYIATYFINLAFFVPLGLLGICTLNFLPNKLKNVLVYCILVTGLFYGSEYRTKILAGYKTSYTSNLKVPPDNFFTMVKADPVQRQIRAIAEIKHLVYPLKLPVRILQDSSSIFPASQFTDGVEISINYGNLKEKSTFGNFDYILLNSDNYYGKRLQPKDAGRELANSSQQANDLEEETRKTLRKTGDFYGRKYSLIYSGYDALLYKLE